ncbi:Oligoribonuclease [Serratia symbiotica]|nr:Oligoribonuclease [Serratia symbiotica]
MKKKENNLIWIDLEMTGLNPECNHIIEIATLVTDYNLKILAEGPILAIHQSEEKLKIMDEWNKKTHSKSGLLQRVKNSCLNDYEAEIKTITFLKKWIPAGKSPMCGNSVGQDRRFLFRYMPVLEKYFHYRYLDVSTLKELAKRWKPNIINNYNKKKLHKANDDIYASITELKYYRKNFFQL